MSRKPTNTETIIAAIKTSHEGARLIAEAVAKELSVHTLLDDSRHEENKQTLAAISADVKSLLESRTFTKGIWKAVVGTAVAVSTIIGLVIAWVKG